MMSRVGSSSRKPHLVPMNLAEAVNISRAEFVDVSSGVEKAPGEKDPAKIRAFLARAKAL